MSMDDNAMMAEVIRQSYEENPTLHRQINVLQRKLDIATKAFDDILEFKRTGYFGLNFDVWQIIQKAIAEIDEIK